MQTSDFLIIGAGVIGLAIARELRQRHPDARITVLEKESTLAAHASGRNSGVLHAGFYYSADSLKARFSQQGNQEMTAFCREQGLLINPCGKLVVARDESELKGLGELLARGLRNNVPVEMVDAAQAREIEPRIRTFERALWSPTTASVDPVQVVTALAAEVSRQGVDIRTGTAYLGRKGQTLQTSAGDHQAGYVINAAGLYADRIARDFGFSSHYRVLPFKGLYLYSSEPPGSLRTNVYPVPDLRNPFLGVHFTVTASGLTKIGPTAIPAFWREQYNGWENFSGSELTEILWRQAGLFLASGFDFKRLAWEEIRKYYRPIMVGFAEKLVEGVSAGQYRQWGRPGIRAQLLDIRERKLEMDFVFERDEQSLHILNAVSPAFTCAFPFARHICDQVE